jgi:hypothetical protein
VGLKLNGTHQLLVYANDVNLLGYVVNTIKKKGEAVIDASKEVDLQENAEKTKYMLQSGHQNAGQNRDMKIDNRAFEYVANFKYLGTTIKNGTLFHEGIESRLYFGTECYHSVRKSCLLVYHLNMYKFQSIIL